MNNQTLNTGEKRSVTISLKKFGAAFVQENADLSKFDSKNDFIEALYSFWVEKSKENKTAWIKTTDYSLFEDFKVETLDRISTLFSDTISNIPEKELELQVSEEVVAEATPAQVEKVVVEETTKEPVFIKSNNATPRLRSKKKRLRKKFEKKMERAYARS